MTLVSNDNFNSRFIDNRFKVPHHAELIRVTVPIQWHVAGNSTKELLEGLLLVVRVHRSYFKVEVSLLYGKKQTYLNITCCATIGRIIIQYL
jgi:hypothetical protein